MLHGMKAGRTISMLLAFSHHIPELWHLYLWSALDYQVFFWLVDQPVFPACSWLWHSVRRRPDAEPGHMIPLSFEPALVSAEISLHVFQR